MRMSQRHSLAAVVQTIKDSIKIVNTNIKRNKPMKKATRKSISQNKIVAKTAVKRKFSEEEVINLNNKKRKLNSPVIGLWSMYKIGYNNVSLFHSNMTCYRCQEESSTYGFENWGAKPHQTS